jgi:hypothetical protein
MAVAIMGGLIVATVLTLLALPAMYAAWFRVRVCGGTRWQQVKIQGLPISLGGGSASRPFCCRRGWRNW